MWKVKYWQAVIDKSPPNVLRWKLTNVSDEIWRAGGAWRPDNRRRNRVGKLNLNSPAAKVCLYAEFQQCQFILYFDSNWSLSSGEGRIGVSRERRVDQKIKTVSLPQSLILRYIFCFYFLFLFPGKCDLRSSVCYDQDSHMSLVVLSVANREKVL